MEGLELPPWLSTTLAVFFVLGVVLPPLGRLIAIRWPVLGTRLEALGNDFTRGLGPRPEAPTPAQAKARVRRVLAQAEKKPPAPPPLPLLMLLAFLLVSCTDLRPVVGVANGARTAGHAYAAVVERLCTKPAERAAKLPEAEAAAEAERLRDLGCYQALHAQNDVAEAHRVMHDLIVAIQAGQCVATIARDVPASCDVRAAAEQLAEAGARLGAAVERLERGER